MDPKAEKIEGKLNKGRRRALWRLFVAAVICIIFIVVIFIIGGLIAKSLAVISKALHMLSDLSTLTINFISITLAYCKENKTFTYGFHRTGTYTLCIAYFNRKIHTEF